MARRSLGAISSRDERCYDQDDERADPPLTHPLIQKNERNFHTNKYSIIDKLWSVMAVTSACSKPILNNNPIQIHTDTQKDLIFFFFFFPCVCVCV
jgi:hypothetical protein